MRHLIGFVISEISRRWIRDAPLDHLVCKIFFFCSAGTFWGAFFLCRDFFSSPFALFDFFVFYLSQGLHFSSGASQSSISVAFARSWALHGWTRIACVPAVFSVGQSSAVQLFFRFPLVCLKRSYFVLIIRFYKLFHCL